MAGLKGIKTIRDFELADKFVFLRLDLNVPIENGKITDETRITASLPTINYAIEKGAKLVIASHLGRPKAFGDKKYSMEPVANRLTEILKKEIILVEDPKSDAVKALVNGMKKPQILLLENLRYEPGETANSDEFAGVMAEYTQVYINDAFGASHRAHASIDALPRMVKQKGIGFLIEKEIEMLDRLMTKPAKPYLAIMGGAKVSDKIDVFEKMMDVVDGFVIGGAMAYTFLKARGVPVGKSLVENDKLGYAKEMMARIEARRKTMLLPVDHMVTMDIASKKAEMTSSEAIAENYMGVDIGPKTIANYSKAISEAKTIFWNGPMGIFETTEYSKGTFAIAKALAESNAFRIVGGGDSAAAAEASGYASKMDHISTGGGASLEYLQGIRLPGIEALRPPKTSEKMP